MKKLTSIIACILLTSFMWAVSVYGHDISFEPLNSRLLPSNYVKCLYQDSEGFVWIATNNGLARYDGHDVVPFSRYLEGNTFIYEIIEDADGKLLLGTDKGLFSFDRISWRMDALIEGFAISSVIRDGGNGIWAGGADGLFFRPEGEKDFAKAAIFVDNEPVEGVIDLMEGPDGGIWMTTWHKGLYVYDPSDRTTRVFKKDKLAYSYVLHRDSDGWIWVGTWGEGLLRLDPDFMDTSGYVSWSASHPDGEGLLDDVIYAIDDIDGHILVGGQKGFSILDPGTGVFHPFVVGSGRDCLPYNQVNSILVTSGRNVWLGLYGGGMCSVRTEAMPYIIDHLPEVKERFSTNTVHSICSDVDGRLWMGVSDQGFILYDPAAHTAWKHNEIPSFRNLLSISTAVAISRRTSSSEICFATYSEGLWLYDPASGRVRVLSAETCAALATNNILALENDSRGNLWIGTNRGAFVLSPDDSLLSLGSFLSSSVSSSVSCPVEGQVMDISASADGHVFLATSDCGIAEIGLDDRTFECHVLEEDETPPFQNVLVDGDGKVWAGSSNSGLYLYDRRNKVLESRNPICDLDSQGINNLVRLEDGEIWLTTVNDIVSFRDDAETASVEVTRYISDLETSFSCNCVLPSADTLVFGTTEGLFKYSSTGDILHDGCCNTLAVTDFIINGESCRNLDMFDRDINHVAEIKARKGDNIEIRYTLLDYGHFLSPVYRCTCDGLQKDTAEESVSFRVSKGRTVIEIAHKASGQSKTIIILARSDMSWLLILLAAAALCLAFLYFYQAGKRKNGENRSAEDKGSKTERKGEDHDVIAFEIKGTKIPSGDQQLLQKAMGIVHNHISDSDFNQTDFIREMGISRTLLTDKLKELTGFTPISLILEVRLKTAYQTIMSAEDKLRISDVAYSVGFNDAKYFREVL